MRYNGKVSSIKGEYVKYTNKTSNRNKISNKNGLKYILDSNF